MALTEVEYFGKVTITFELLKPEKSIMIDFGGRGVCDMTVNGEKLSDVKYEGQQIEIPGVKLGINKVQISFLNSYKYSLERYDVGLHSVKMED